jgi:hypothetical protein
MSEILKWGGRLVPGRVDNSLIRARGPVQVWTSPPRAIAIRRR